MKRMLIPGPLSFRGEISVVGDKSITHRALILGFLAGNPFCMDNPNPGADCRRTLDALVCMGLEFCSDGTRWHLVPGGQWRRESHSVYAGNSGTTARLLLGLAPWLDAGCSLTIDGDQSLRRRPMARVTDLLAAAGVRVECLDQPGFLPLRAISLGARPAAHRVAVASAQVKSALLLAGLAAKGLTKVSLPGGSRDHTELMLEAMGCKLRCDHDVVMIEGSQRLTMPCCYQVPGDVSAASYWAAGAAVSGNVRIKSVGLNPGRTVFLDILSRMGAGVSTENVRWQHGEKVGDVVVQAHLLRPTEVKAEEVPGCIDELPLVAVVAAHAAGTTVICGAEELRFKETDRLAETLDMLTAFGVGCWAQGGRIGIEGGQPLHPANYVSDDHRMVMAAAVLAAGAPGMSNIGDTLWSDVSYPGFEYHFANLAALDYNRITEECDT